VIVPLAVSGLAIISVVVVGALVLLYVLFRNEDHYEGEEEPRPPEPREPDIGGPPAHDYPPAPTRGDASEREAPPDEQAEPEA
jgi:hypothetical protein